MENNEIAEKIEDFAVLSSYVGMIAYALRTGTPLPSSVPVMNDLTLTDNLASICEEVGKMRKKP